MPSHVIGEIDDFPRDRGTPLEVSGVSIAVFNVDGTIYAVHDNCPHKNLPLHQVGIKTYRSTMGSNQFYSTDENADNPKAVTRGKIIKEGESCSIECPWHSLEIDLESGYCPVRDARIPTYELNVDDGGTVRIML